MRFGISDLLLLSALVVFYATFAGLSPNEASRSIDSWTLLPFGLLALVAVSQTIINWRRLGGVIVSWRARDWWRRHVQIAVLVMVIYATGWGPTAGVDSEDVPVFLCIHVFVVATTTGALGDQGVLTQMSIRRWRHYFLELDETACVIRYRPRLGPNGRPLSWRHDGEVQFPESKLDEIRSAFAMRAHWSPGPSDDSRSV